MKTIKPQLCKDVGLNKAKELMDNPEWIIEEKYDGSRLIAVNDNEIYLQSRRGEYKSYRYPFVKKELSEHPNCILDGELVVFNKNGLSDHSLLMEREVESQGKIRRRSKYLPATFYIFDILKWKGESLLGESLEERKRILEENISEGDHLKVVPYHKGEVNFEDYKGEGFVLKKLNSKYRKDKRSRNWRKLKFNKDKIITVNEYEEHPKGIVVKNDNLKVNINGVVSKKVKKRIDKEGKVDIEVSFLEETKNGKLRFPTFKRMVNNAKNDMR